MEREHGPDPLHLVQGLALQRRPRPMGIDRIGLHGHLHPGPGRTDAPLGASGVHVIPHEPEDDLICGSPAEFRAAYAHIRRIFEANGVSVRWVAALMASTYDGGNGGYRQWLPPTYDLIGVDGYNRYPCVDDRSHHP